jgi:hypothetical protein
MRIWLDASVERNWFDVVVSAGETDRIIWGGTYWVSEAGQHTFKWSVQQKVNGASAGAALEGSCTFVTLSSSQDAVTSIYPTVKNHEFCEQLDKKRAGERSPMLGVYVSNNGTISGYASMRIWLDASVERNWFDVVSAGETDRIIWGGTYWVSEAGQHTFKWSVQQKANGASAGAALEGSCTFVTLSSSQDAGFNSISINGSGFGSQLSSQPQSLSGSNSSGSLVYTSSLNGSIHTSSISTHTNTNGSTTTSSAPQVICECLHRLSS